MFTAHSDPIFRFFSSFFGNWRCGDADLDETSRIVHKRNTNGIALCTDCSSVERVVSEGYPFREYVPDGGG